MLVVLVDTKKLDYDIHSLVKAFYPGETVKVLSPGTEVKKKEELCNGPFMKIILQEESPRIVFFKEGAAAGEYSFSLPGNTKKDRQIGKEEKNLFKAGLYKILCDYTGKALPWGNLTGIRPTKIAMGMLEEGRTSEEIREFMQDSHFVSPAKTKLSIEIAKRERELLSRIHAEDGYSLYIGIPFCPTTCLYCSFTSYPICAYEGIVETYIDCLCREMDYVAETYKERPLDSVYIGGGTPTTLLPGQLDRLLSHLEKRFDMSDLLEFTVEAGRADSITADKLAVLKKHGVSRISVNPQTMKDETLQLIGRRHTTAQVKDAFFLARKTGFDNINMDLILGLPGEDAGDVTKTIDAIRTLAPDSLTVHSLAVKRASKLRQWIEENGTGCLNNTDETMAVAAAGAREMGMYPYYLYRQKNMSGNFENVGYAKPGKYGIYNILIMEELQTIMALGAGSISKVVLPGGRIERADNVKDVKLYIEKLDEMLERKRKLFQLQKDKGWFGQ